ncbi:hypothetical protein NQZ68_027915 [Dissostichus eleginoides]|nr:hypothetical protein NQZ68_027915 [Dissostichus eleginoides]
MSLGELIELRDLRPDRERIELTHSTHTPCLPPRLERANALRISPSKVPDLLSRAGIIRVLSSTQDPDLTEENGEGHNFQPCSHAQPTWCDLCGDFIWGLYKQSLRCVNCRFTCHHRCRDGIRLDCSWDRGSVAEHACVVEHTIETDTNVTHIDLSSTQIKCMGHHITFSAGSSSVGEGSGKQRGVRVAFPFPMAGQSRPAEGILCIFQSQLNGPGWVGLRRGEGSDACWAGA